MEGKHAAAVDGGVSDIPEDGLSQAEGHGWDEAEGFEKNVSTSEVFGGKAC